MLRNQIIFKEINNIFIRLPAPVNISYFWNFRSCLGLLLILQLLSRIILSIIYVSNSDITFNKINYIIIDNNYRWILRFIHAIRASFIILVLYLHLLRRLYFKRYVNKIAWNAGTILILIIIATAFLGYVLPWGQISFWRATVITNLITTVPFIRDSIVKWLWGGFSVSRYTLTRFFSFHFILPILIVVVSILHLLVIHSLGARNILGTPSNLKIDFWPFFGFKDLFRFFVLMFFYFVFIFYNPYSLIDSENFIAANPSVTPLHIKPEWYFLFAYAILRSIPNKTARVLVLVLSIVIFFLFPLGNTKVNYNYYFFYKLLFFFFIFNFTILTWLRRCPVKLVFNFFSQICRIIYFFLLFLLIYF